MHTTIRTTLVLGALTALAACTGDDASKRVLGPQLTGANAIFQSYVAIGNSITAGYQSSGISDATQKVAYPLLLAQQMGTRYAYPSLFGVGCPPPVTNFQTQARPTGTTSTTCLLRNPASSTDILNNVAVPGASSFDPTDADGTPFSNTLTSLFLGGKSQVQKALEASPTFATIWIGNNDVLGFAVQDGRTAALAGMTSVATFQANYDAMISQLTTGAPGIKGVLIGVVQVANAPIMFPAVALQNPQFKGGFDAIAGKTTVLDPSCAPGGAGAGSLINSFLPFQIRLGAHPAIIACVPGGASGALPAPVGDILVLDPAEQATIQARIDAYNSYISAKAASIDFAYVDPNALLLTLKAGGTVVRQVPNWAATGTFGTGMSLDGVHPAAGVQREIANALIAAINAKYGTSLVAVP
ncbi:MAG TPA: SGNH/GDSL hydrolase family protein [Gemmatimonadaceae bacterium]|nr:SGNH/GDSL hydrolase family protein [Gemmatimonadaceae bacterium]